ncbi:ribose-phosphate pyrophosphokinase [Candidatus Woesearchaeota archaeon]|nr:MAG: ribose-phosphate pyrophosphokinase [Candidatus Woesearchaeota archaeon]
MVKQPRRLTGFITPEQHSEAPLDLQSTRRKLTFATLPAARHLAKHTLASYNRFLSEAGSAWEYEMLPIRHRQHGEGELIPRVPSSVDGADVFLFGASWDPSFITRSRDELFGSLSAHGLLADDVTLDDFVTGRATIAADTPQQVLTQALIQKLSNANIMETLLYARAFKSQGAAHVTLVMPYWPYGRQEKPTRLKRESTTSRLIADLVVEAGVDGLITYDPHSRALHGNFPEGRFLKKFIDADEEAYKVFKEYKGREDVQFAFLDSGAVDRGDNLRRRLGLDPVIIGKVHHGDVENLGNTGLRPTTRYLLFIEDILGSGTTLKKGITPIVEELRRRNAHLAPGEEPRDVQWIGYISNPLCTKDAEKIVLELSQNYGLKQLNISNSIQLPSSFLKIPCVVEHGLQDLLAKYINAIHYQTSTTQHATSYDD